MVEIVLAVLNPLNLPLFSFSLFPFFFFTIFSCSHKFTGIILLKSFCRKVSNLLYARQRFPVFRLMASTILIADQALTWNTATDRFIDTNYASTHWRNLLLLPRNRLSQNIPISSLSLAQSAHLGKAPHAFNNRQAITRSDSVEFNGETT